MILGRTNGGAKGNIHHLLVLCSTLAQPSNTIIEALYFKWRARTGDAVLGCGCTIPHQVYTRGTGEHTGVEAVFIGRFRRRTVSCPSSSSTSPFAPQKTPSSRYARHLWPPRCRNEDSSAAPLSTAGGGAPRKGRVKERTHFTQNIHASALRQDSMPHTRVAVFIRRKTYR